MEPLLLWWIGEAPMPVEPLEHTALHLRRAYGLDTLVVQSALRPQHTLDARRGQHHSSRLLEWLLQHAPAGRVLGITDVDLFIPILTFVFGEAQLGGRAAVVSTWRLRDGAAGPRALAERLGKEAVHEVGHALGLLHCQAPACAMSRSASVREVDRKRGELCADCLTLLPSKQERLSR